MDAADLDRQARTLSGCIPPDLVAQLLERGHEREVASQAGQGEWFCARAWARLLGERGQRDNALAVLAPYVATGWWPAARAQVELLESWGRASEALALTRPYAAAGGQALEFFARLLARHGGAAEAFELLSAGIEDWVLATALVDVAELAGLDDDAARLLSEHIPDDHRCDSPWCCGGLDADTALSLLARIRERQGRTDEAIALLHTRRITSVNSRDQLADLLARHGRLDELRKYAATDVHGHATQRLAEVLEERGDVEGAISLYRRAAAAVPGGSNTAYQLAQLLARHGRGAEAVDVMRAQADAHPGEDWILHTLAGLCLDRDRPEDGLAHLDELKAARGDDEEEWDLFWIRLPLIATSSGPDAALQQASAHPEGDSAYAAEHMARVLHNAGRTEEAIALLDRHLPAHRSDMAAYFISLDMIDDAVELLQQHDPRPTAQWNGHWSSEPPF